MRVNVYAEEMTQRVELVSKIVDGQEFIGIRFYLELPVTQHIDGRGFNLYRGPFYHSEGDDDSAAVTFWGKKDSTFAFQKALNMLAAYRDCLSKGTAPGQAAKIVNTHQDQL